MDTRFLEWIVTNVFEPDMNGSGREAILIALRDQPNSIAQFVVSHVGKWSAEAARTLGSVAISDGRQYGDKVVELLCEKFKDQIALLPQPV